MAKKKEAVVIEEVGDKQLVPVRPNDVYVHNNALHGACGRSRRTRQSFDNLILFFRELGGWQSFTLKQLSKFYKRQRLDKNIMFEGLMGAQYEHPSRTNGDPIEVDQPPVYLVFFPSDKRYRITTAFIEAIKPSHKAR
jgi:hypothetical protein